MRSDAVEFIAQAPSLTDKEKYLVLTEWNRTAVDYSDQKFVQQLFAAQAAVTPLRNAVITEDGILTYSDLETRANQVAHHLRELGVESDVRVALSMHRCADMVIAILGILKAGGAYVPLDPSYPADRLVYMLEDSTASVVVTRSDVYDPSLGTKATIVRLDSDWERIGKQPATDPENFLHSDNLAYVIYTSGSTGRPKGVMISHGALRNHMLWMQAAFPLCKNDVLLQKTALSFDASVWEILGPLLSGATLALAKPEGQKDPSYLCNAIARWEVTTLQMVPSGLQLFLDDPGIQGMKSLRNVFSGGEPLTAELSKKTLERLDARVHNLYGPTETCIQSVVHSCGPAEQQANNKTAIPIGRPISNTQTYVADQYLQLVPPGNVAELYIGGAGVARGYCGRPDLTAERFLPNPFGAPGSRLYRTGDLVRHLANGTLEFCGRVDDQIKLRGYRIELHEIEQTLLSCPGVQRAIVIARDDGQREKRLVAYVTVSEKDATDAADLRSVLEQSLPQYMVPSAFVVLDEFPVMPNGKIDRQALPAPDPRAGLPEYVAPRTPREEILAKMWTETLGIEQIGMDDNFFDLGGTSVALVRIFRQAQKLFGITMQISAIAKAATIGSFARAVEEKVA